MRLEAEKLIAQTLDTLDELVPIGAVKTANDLVDATKDLGHKTVPPIASQIASAQSRISDAISRLAPAELHCAATQLGLQPTTLEWGARVIVIRARKLMRQQAAELLADVDFDEVGYPDVDFDDHGDHASDPRSRRPSTACAPDSQATGTPLTWSRYDAQWPYISPKSEMPS